MRRKDRELTECADILAVMRNCTLCRLSIADNPAPYIVPLHFGLEEHGGQITLWFHSAPVGKKIDLLRQNGAAAFEMDLVGELKQSPTGCDCSRVYESVIGYGMVTFAEDVMQKRHGLQKILEQNGVGQKPMREQAVARTCVFRLDIVEMTGKAHRLPNSNP